MKVFLKLYIYDDCLKVSGHLNVRQQCIRRPRGVIENYLILPCHLFLIQHNLIL